MQTYGILLTIVVIIFVIRYLVALDKKRSEARRKRNNDRIIENLLLYGIEETYIKNAANHSNLGFIGGVIGSRIAELIKQGMNPRVVYDILNNLGLVITPTVNTNDKEVTLRALIKNAILHTLDDHDLEVWMIKSQQAKQADWDKIKKTFLATEVKHNGFIMQLKLG